MWLDVVNGIPIVGPTKGLFHYLVGDVVGGNEAMKQSTRTSLVMGAGAVGSITGPAGAIALGAATGALWDTVESIMTDEPTGVVAGVKNIADTALKGEVPIKGVLQTALCVGGDAVGAYGGTSIVSSFSNSAGKSVATTAGKSIGRSAGKSLEMEAMKIIIERQVDKAVMHTVTHCVARDMAESMEKTTEIVSKRPPPSNQSKPPQPKPRQDQSPGPTCGGSGQKPPGRNPSNINEPPQQEQTESFWQEFLDLFKAKSLNDISIRGRHIFRCLNKGQKSYLKKIIKILHRKGILKNVIETLKNIFNTVDLEDVTFLNFLSLVEIIMQFIGERAARINEKKRERQEFPDSYDERRTESIRIACDEILLHDYNIVRVIEAIKDAIKSQALPINFRDIFAAVYHYLKHRHVGQEELSVQEYYDLLKINLEIIMETNEYKGLKNDKNIVFERYYEVYKMRFRIVITKKDGCVILCTGFFFDYDGTDQDSDMYINGRFFRPE